MGYSRDSFYCVKELGNAAVKALLKYPEATLFLDYKKGIL
jgi:hypothetical protein